MNEVFRRRLVGLAVLLALMFALSLLLPDDAGDGATPGAPSTTVNLAGGSERPTEAGLPANALPTEVPAGASKADEESVAAIPAEKPAPHVDAAADKAPVAKLKLSPSLQPPPDRAVAAPSTPKPQVPAKEAPPKSSAVSKPETAQPPKPKLAESVAKPPIEPPPASGARWFVQIGSFSDPDKATTVLGLLKGVGYQGEVTKIVNPTGAALHRVRLGAYASEAAARQVQEKVAHQGYPQARVVPEVKK